MILLKIIMSNAKDYYNKYSKQYLEKWKSIDSDLDNPTNYFRKRLIDTALQMANVQQGDKVLEIGCGTGLVLKELLKITKPVFGVDVSSEMLKGTYQVLSDKKILFVDFLPPKEKRETDVYLMIGDFTNLNLSPDYFDKFFSIEVLRYIPDIKACLLNVKKVMKPNSLFAFTVTNFWSLSTFPLKFYLRQKFGLVKDDEIIQYCVTERSIRRILKELNFKTVHFRKFRMLSINPVISRLFLKNRKAVEKIEKIDKKLENMPIFCSFFDTFLVVVQRLD